MSLVKIKRVFKLDKLLCVRLIPLIISSIAIFLFFCLGLEQEGNKNIVLILQLVLIYVALKEICVFIKNINNQYLFE